MYVSKKVLFGVAISAGIALFATTAALRQERARAALLEGMVVELMFQDIVNNYNEGGK